jgi:hypothetical protein
MSATERAWLLGACGGNVRDFYDAISIVLPATTGLEVAVHCFASPASHNRDDRKSSCSVNLTSGLWHCQGCGESGNAYRAALVRGYSEQRSRELARQYGLFIEQVQPTQAVTKLPGERDLKKWRIALREDPDILAWFMTVKGWKPGAMVRLGLGWDGERLTFPIRTSKAKIAGVVRYLPGGKPKTLALPGTKRDLFPAPELIRRHHPLFLVEGEPDAVAVWSTGFKAVAIPGAGSWRREWATRLMGRRVIVLTDCDQQGRALAEKVATDLPDVQVVDLEPGRSDGYDIGDWIREASQEGGLRQVSRVLERLVA